MNTIEAIRRIKAELPGVYTTLGVSNVSFGLKPAARHVLNSVFLHECVEAGLDSAIVHAARIMPLNKIPEDQVKVCLDLIYDRRDEATGYDPLAALLDVFADVTVAKAEKEDRSGWPVEERLKARIIDGDRDGLTADLDEAMAEGLAPLDHQRRPAGRHEGRRRAVRLGPDAAAVRAAVGRDHEGRGRPPRAAHGEGRGRPGKGRIVLATVKGDVHDIGKNLVDIILTNNGYEVHNLGIKIGIAEMIEKAQEVKADAIGMSGLLVKSTLIMRDNLEELNVPRAGRHPGAAGRRRPDPQLRRARPARHLRAAGCSTARTPSRASTSWTGSAPSSGAPRTTTPTGAGCRPTRGCRPGPRSAWPRRATSRPPTCRPARPTS